MDELPTTWREAVLLALGGPCEALRAEALAELALAWDARPAPPERLH